MAARALRFLHGEDNQQEAHAMQQNKLDFGAFIRDANGNYAMARPATEAELIAQASAILETRLRGEPLTSPEIQRVPAPSAGPAGARGIRVSVSRQPAPRDRLRDAVSRHHRRGVGLSARGRQNGSPPQRRRRNLLPQSPFGRG